MVERKAYTAFGEMEFGEMGFGETGRHRYAHSISFLYYGCTEQCFKTAAGNHGK